MIATHRMRSSCLASHSHTLRAGASRRRRGKNGLSSCSGLQRGRRVIAGSGCASLYAHDVEVAACAVATTMGAVAAPRASSASSVRLGSASFIEASARHSGQVGERASAPRRQQRQNDCWQQGRSTGSRKSSRHTGQESAICASAAACSAASRDSCCIRHKNSHGRFKLFVCEISSVHGTLSVL